MWDDWSRQKKNSTMKNKTLYMTRCIFLNPQAPYDNQKESQKSNLSPLTLDVTISRTPYPGNWKLNIVSSLSSASSVEL